LWVLSNQPQSRRKKGDKKKNCAPTLGHRPPTYGVKKNARRIAEDDGNIVKGNASGRYIKKMEKRVDPHLSEENHLHYQEKARGVLTLVGGGK